MQVSFGEVALWGQGAQLRFLVRNAALVEAGFVLFLSSCGQRRSVCMSVKKKKKRKKKLGLFVCYY